MKLGPSLQIYAVTQPPANEPAAKQLDLETHPPTLAPLGSILPDGTYIGLLGLHATQNLKQFSDIDWSKLPSIRLPLSYKTETPPPVAIPTPTLAEQPGFFARSKSALSWWSGTTTVVHFTQGMSQAQVSQCVGSLPISQQQASGATDAIMRSLHSHAGNAIFVAISAGGIGGALATLFGYKKLAPAIALATSIVGLILFYFLSKESSPYEHTWSMNPIKTTYEEGIPPRQAVEEITQDKDGLGIAHHAIGEDGKRENLAFHINPDGQEHPGELPGQVVITTRKGNTLTSVYSKNGLTVETDTRVLSSDQKNMTVTAVRVAPSGQTLKDVTVYERQ